MKEYIWFMTFLFFTMIFNTTCEMKYNGDFNIRLTL
jgi:hypothetical protein